MTTFFIVTYIVEKKENDLGDSKDETPHKPDESDTDTDKQNNVESITNKKVVSEESKSRDVVSSDDESVVASEAAAHISPDDLDQGIKRMLHIGMEVVYQYIRERIETLVDMYLKISSISSI